VRMPKSGGTPLAGSLRLMPVLPSRSELTGIHVLSSMSLRRLTYALCVSMLSCIMMTYSMCLNERHCPAFLPMISDSELPIPYAADGPQRCHTLKIIPALGG